MLMALATLVHAMPPVQSESDTHTLRKHHTAWCSLSDNGKRKPVQDPTPPALLTTVTAANRGDNIWVRVSSPVLWSFLGTSLPSPFTATRNTMVRPHYPPHPEARMSLSLLGKVSGWYWVQLPYRNRESQKAPAHPTDT
jgi:hypothetical protein